MMMRLKAFFASAAIVATTIAVTHAQQAAAPAQQPAANATPAQLPDPTPPDGLPRPSTTDPRSNLKPGAVGTKAAEAAWNIELVANLAKPSAFANEKEPLGYAPPPVDPNAP